VKVQARAVGLARYLALRTVNTNRYGYFSFKALVKVKRAFRFYYGTDAIVTSSVRTVEPS
jgi:hypothetical protein